MSAVLADFQDAFSMALLADTEFGPAQQPGFRVYRNTVASGCIDALLANFPSVLRLVGEEWLRGAARIYSATRLPRETSLLRYGEDFPGFLAAFEPARELPYLAGVAQLDYAWILAHVAADAAPVSADEFQGLSPLELGALRLRPHPSARWAWFAGQPVYTIWDANRRQVALADEFAWRGEGALLCRPRDEVTWMPLDRAGWAFMEACRAGRALAEAALEAGWYGADVPTLFAGLLGRGALTRSDS